MRCLYNLYFSEKLTHIAPGTFSHCLTHSFTHLPDRFIVNNHLNEVYDNKVPPDQLLFLLWSFTWVSKTFSSDGWCLIVGVFMVGRELEHNPVRIWWILCWYGSHHFHNNQCFSAFLVPQKLSYFYLGFNSWWQKVLHRRTSIKAPH